MLESLMKYCNNYFYKSKEASLFNINNEMINANGKYIIGQYVRIMGSVMNDGVYRIKSIGDNGIGLEGLLDEEFEGYLMGLVVPKEFISISNKVDEFINEEVNNKKINKPTKMSSESFGSYSYSVLKNEKGMSATWSDIFANELKPYRKINDGFRYVEDI